MSAGKGPRPRPIKLSAYQKNYERIFKARMQALRECRKLKRFPENMGNVLSVVKDAMTHDLNGTPANFTRRIKADAKRKQTRLKEVIDCESGKFTKPLHFRKP